MPSLGAESERFLLNCCFLYTMVSLIKNKGKKWKDRKRRREVEKGGRSKQGRGD